MTKTIAPSELLSAVADRSRHRGYRGPSSSVIKRSIKRDGHKSSVSLEDQFWDGLHEIAEREGVTVSALVARIDRGDNRRNLSSAIRVFVLDHFRHNGHGLPVGRSNADAPSVSPVRIEHPPR